MVTLKDLAEETSVWTAAARAAHRGLSAADLKFRELVCAESPAVRRSLPPLLAESQGRFKYRLQALPTFLGGEKLAELQRVSIGVSKLLKSVPERLLDNDPEKVAEFYHLPSPVKAELLLSPPNGIDGAVARGDLIDTADGFKCIEFNFTPNLGGWETSLLAPLHLTVPETARFVAREGLAVSYTPTTRLLFRHTLDDVVRQGLSPDGEVNIALVFGVTFQEDPVFEEAVAHLSAEFDAACREAGGVQGRVVVCDYADLTPVQWQIFWRDLRIHAAIEFSDQATTANVYRCFKVGNLALFNGPVGAILSTKENVAALSENADSARFRPEERELIRRHIPWTRRVLARQTDFRGEPVFLPELLVAERERLVLKEATNYGGKGVFLGKFTSAAQWAELVRTALDKGGWVVQEHLTSLPYLYQSEEHGLSPHDVIWGPFVFGETYAGVILRMQPRVAGGAVNLSLAATEGVVLEVAGTPAPPGEGSA
jgi:hypothetical protein